MKTTERYTLSRWHPAKSTVVPTNIKGDTVHKHQSHKRVRYALALIPVLLFSSMLTSCSKTYSSSDAYKCAINTKTGKIDREIPPGSGEIDQPADTIIYTVPTSDRFYNIDPNRSIADDGASDYVKGRSTGYKDTQAVVHVRFKFNQTKICQWVLRHGKRNDGNSDGDLQFNARLAQGDANQPNRRALTEWAVWLNENFGSNIQRVAEPLWQRYDWPYMVYNYPVNADSNGQLAADVKPNILTRKQLETDIGKAFSDELKSKLGDDFFCGVGYDPTKPDVCPSIDIQIDDITLADKKAMDDRKALDVQRDEAKNLEEQSRINDDIIAKKTAAKQSEDKLRELETQLANAKESDKRAQLEEQLKTARIQAEIDNQSCIVKQEQAGYTCAEEEAAKHQQGNTSVQVNPPVTQPSK